MPWAILSRCAALEDRVGCSEPLSCRAVSQLLPQLLASLLLMCGDSCAATHVLNLQMTPSSNVVGLLASRAQNKLEGRTWRAH